MRLAATAALLLLPLSASIATADSEEEKLMRYGEQLAQECVTCHRRDGKDDGIPPITVLTEQDMISALMLYKTGRRKNKVMVSVAASLDETQMRAIAIYLSSLGKAQRQAAPTPPKPKPVGR